MTRAVTWMVAALLMFATRPAFAQDEPPAIGPFAIAIRGTIPRFPDKSQITASRGFPFSELPGSGFGFDVDGQVYLLRIHPVTFGLGGLLTVGSSHSSAQFSGGQLVVPRVEERLVSWAPEISFNFGTGNGWSYISGGIGPSVWSVEQSGVALPQDQQRLQTINYGGGARWFALHHVAFTFDVRFWAINPSTGALGLPGGPRTTLLILGAGVAVK